jgi:hypothetical protein
MPVPINNKGLQEKLIVVPEVPVNGNDLFLGSPWFAGHVWQIDYGSHKMLLAPDWKPSIQDHSIRLGFKTGPNGVRRFNMPRIAIAVDGRALDVLFDTGAQATTTDESAPIFQVTPGVIVGASFIARTVFDEWHARHPDWRFIASGDGLHGRAFPMIEVPRVNVAGFDIGPVWFALRPDVNFSGKMGFMMDKPVQGALGGSGLQYFRIVLDYPRATAWFRPTVSSKLM